MARKTNQTGFGEKYNTSTKRVINTDGSFNVIKDGAEHRSVYQYLIGIGWGKFMLIVFCFYLVFNSAFALLYMWAGIENLTGMRADSNWEAFWEAFFFSVQTFTTVGYGAISPTGFYTNLISAIEAMTGLLGFALATGLLYGRFSQPRHSIRFSKNAVIVNNKGQKEFHFQIVNTKSHVLMELDARVLVKVVDRSKSGFDRNFYELKLVVSKIIFFPLNWRISHIIDEKSPLYEADSQKLKDKDIEVLILINGYDSTFNQNVRARYSYTYKEIICNARFAKAYETNPEGDTVMDIDKIDEVIVD